MIHRVKMHELVQTQPHIYINLQSYTWNIFKIILIILEI